MIPSQVSSKEGTLKHHNNSRVPTKSSVDSGHKSKGFQHVSRLAKRPSTNNNVPAPVKSTSRTPTPVAEVGHKYGPDRRGSITPATTSTPAPTSMRTPSLVSGSSASTFDSPRSNTLRRKPSSAIDRYAAQKRSGTDGLQLVIPDNLQDIPSRQDFDDSVFGISPPSTSQHVVSQPSNALTYESLKYRDFPIDHTPAMTGYALSATPSTRFDSPFSHAPTPSSASSYSSGVAATAYTNRSRSSTSATRDGLYPSGDGRGNESTRSALLPVRESSSSSSSTVRIAGDAKPKQVNRTKHESTSATTDKATLPVSATARSPARNKLKKEPATFAARKRTNQAPPELAHLNVATPISSAPIRPSRDGTSTIPDVSGPSPVVHSDLPLHYTTYHKRTSSQELATSDVSPSVKSRFGFPTRSSSRNASQRIDSAISPPPTTLRFKRGATPEVPSGEDHPTESSRAHRKDSPAIGTGPSPSKSPRFAFFSRKSKQEPKVPERPRRLSTKGPVAGTGHEGYGRFGTRGRSASNASSTGSRSPSSDSTIAAPHRPSTTRKLSGGSKDSSGLDDFLRDRLEPRILRGSGSTWSQSESVADSVGTSVQPASSKSSLESIPAPSLLPSAIGSSARPSLEQRPFLGRRNTSESSDDGANIQGLGHHGHQFVTNASRSPERVTAAEALVATSRQRSMDHGDVGSPLAPALQMEPPMLSHAAHGAEGNWLRSPSAPIEGKSRRKWNFFQRATASPQTKSKDRVPVHAQGALSAVRTSTHVPVAHFALIESVEPVGLAEVERLVQDVDSSPNETSRAHTGSRDDQRNKHRRASLLPVRTTRDHSALDARPAASANSAPDQRFRPHVESLLPPRPSLPLHSISVSRDDKLQLPQPAQVRPDQYELKSSVHTPDLSARSLSTPDDEHGSSRRPRLSPVGRIPQVKCKRDRERKFSDHSFSRPFVQSQPRPTVKPQGPPGSVYNQIRGMKSPTDTPSHHALSPGVWQDSNVGEQLDSVTLDSAPRGILATEWQDPNVPPGEFMAIPDRKDSQQSYVSSSSGNWSHPSWMSALMAQAPQQDDVWNEYDDLMDAEMHPPSVGPPPTSELPALPGHRTAPAILSVPQQVSRFLQPSLSPMTPDTIFAWVNGYGDRSTIASIDSSGLLDLQRLSAFRRSDASMLSPQISTNALRSSLASRHSRTSSLPEATTYEDSLGLPAKLSQETYLTSISEGMSHDKRHSDNLRYSAHVTGKWLSGGRTLFSPAGNELRLATEARVLVIDGLSSDWSYSIAHAHPSAEVYDMTVGSKLSSSLGWDEADTNLPNNCRRIRIKGLCTAFPFPRGFFNAVVLRFPTATTEEAYLHCVSECKRVLRPGGYLEAVAIDLDLINTGGQARKAVKGLKTRMQVHDQTVCLGNLSDMLLRMIGRKGFEGVQRVLVHVPTAGQVLSQDTGASGSDSSGNPIWQHQNVRTTQKKPSFMDLLDNTHNLVPELGHRNDESITKMVAKVGRWWYSSCYEEALLPSDRSIWNERGLLRECQKQSTRFRLLVCHAQKPMQTRRRTVSV
ncbi:Putative methyltransferase type 11, S-adenosyl-L-methionine-dependent methyltransferase [Septoria linicola]|uniref:Methyltransferase type 11, S-adenosyl-L-methionine-dependent methyltransferase n=1 Tax=Septoria linicola TaxID=215465 RepID=A0A9Q9AIT2_9PEZI|nr:putative methyltransferase type 11, S-adenosyl-L-methionine-dependent methyltransferase [Septoria linicola]USW46963.1 Putative methyltransferase type 11, S-adenosyl-L-methionine-dependent methyltransferase [Septoria linicola]